MTISMKEIKSGRKVSKEKSIKWKMFKISNNKGNNKMPRKFNIKKIERKWFDSIKDLFLAGKNTFKIISKRRLLVSQQSLNKWLFNLK